MTKNKDTKEAKTPTKSCMLTGNHFSTVFKKSYQLHKSQRLLNVITAGSDEIIFLDLFYLVSPYFLWKKKLNLIASKSFTILVIKITITV